MTDASLHSQPHAFKRHPDSDHTAVVRTALHCDTDWVALMLEGDCQVDDPPQDMAPHHAFHRREACRPALLDCGCAACMQIPTRARSHCLGVNPN